MSVGAQKISCPQRAAATMTQRGGSLARVLRASVIVPVRRTVGAALLVASFACACGAVHAQAVDPLALTPEAPPEEAAPAPLGLRLELWRQQFDLRRPSTTQPIFANRAVLDFRREFSIAQDWKVGLSDRFEYLRTPGDDESRNALREVYASWGRGSSFFDAGRINWRSGVAAAFNPTDYLKRGAVIEQGTQNPQALRENRLGTVMLRGQRVANAGSAQLAWLPDVADSNMTSDNGLAPAWDRTNAARAALLKIAPQTGELISADVLAYARAGARPQVGANLTLLAGEAILTYVEYSGGKAAATRGPSEVAPAATWKNQIAAGFAWTTPPGIVATIEYHYSGDALTRTRWAAWQQTIGTPRERELGQVRTERSRAQAPLVQRAWFARLAWADAFGRRDLELATFMRVNAFDRSRLWQADATWHLSERQSVRLIWGGLRGAPRSEYGSAALRSYGSINWVLFV
jgi:hypothetical protein